MRSGLIGLALALAATLAVAQAKASGPAKVTGKSHTTADDLQYWDLKLGNGQVAAPGKKVTVNYAGYLTNGKKFDSSYDHGAPFQFKLGNGEVIKGWDEGVAGMKVGGRRQLKIPATLAYGSQGVQAIPPGVSIPPNATLIFDVELLGVSGGK